MKVSIAMATFNGAEYVQEQLESFLHQELLPDELVISDDGSTDSTMDIIEQFSEKAPFDVVVLKNTGERGYASNFNNALMNTKGEIVFLSDQDDVWFPNKIKNVVQVANQNEDKQFFINDCAYTDKHLKEAGFTKLQQIKAAGMNQSAFMMGCCSATRSEWLKKILPIPSGYKSHDKWINFFAETLSQKVVIEDVLQYYRRHGENVSTFIVNKTSEITKFEKLIRGLKRSFSYQRYKQGYEQDKIMADYLAKHLNFASDWDEEMHKKLQVSLKKINKKNFERKLNMTLLKLFTLGFCK